MEKSYQNITFFFLGILICAFIGFHFSYTAKFPTFEGLTNAHHFHGFMLMSWFAMLIAQPLLIKSKKIELHKQIGKISYVQIPLLLWSIFLVSKVSFMRNLTAMPFDEALGGLSLDIPDIFAFGLFYILAMINKHNSAAHMRYMIGTSLLMIGPGMGRAMIIFGGLPFPVAIDYSLYFTEIVAIAFITFDYTKNKSLKPFSVILSVLIVMHLLWHYQMGETWQGVAGWFVKSFF